MNRKFFRANWMLAVIFVLAGCFGSVIVSQLYGLGLRDFVSGGLYSPHKIDFFLPEGAENGAQRLIGCIGKGEILYKELGSRQQRAVYFTSYRPRVPMVSGRFFRPEDFSEDNRAVVIGADQLKYTSETDGQLFFETEGERYRVLGVAGLNTPSTLDNMVFYNLVQMQQAVPASTFWTVDAGGDSSGFSARAGREFGGITPIERSIVDASRIHGQRGAFYLYLGLAGTALLFNLLCCCIFFVLSRREDLLVYRLVGCSRRYAAGQVVKQFCALFLPASLAGGLLSLLFGADLSVLRAGYFVLLLAAALLSALFAALVTAALCACGAEGKLKEIST